MRTLIQNANHLFLPLSYLLLMAGLMITLGSCTDVEPFNFDELPVEVDPVTKYTGFYEQLENVCSSTNQPLEIRPFTLAGDPNFSDYPQTAKMISISNLGMVTAVDVTAIWKGHTFIIERQEVLNGDELSIIAGELALNKEDELSIFYSVADPKVHHACIAEYKKY